MSRISSDPSSITQTPSTGDARDLRSVDVDKFLELLLAELQNQDPLNPMDNHQMLQQIGQIREISATNQLSDTLGSVLLGQEVATASNLIGKEIEALSVDNKNVKGLVDRVSIEKDENDESRRVIRVHVGKDRFELRNIREIIAPE